MSDASPLAVTLTRDGVVYDADNRVKISTSDPLQGPTLSCSIVGPLGFVRRFTEAARIRCCW
jgi:hypothetical protein